MPDRFSNLTGFVLAGGLSRRMGSPKQNLVLGGQTLLSRQVGLLQSICAQVAVVGGGPAAMLNPAAPDRLDENAPAPVYEDAIPGCGPLGGIYSGILRTHSEYNLFLGCDMPLLTPSFLRFLCGRALLSQADVTLCESSDGRLQTLCAVYRRRTRAAIRASLARGQYKVLALYPRVRCCVVRWREIVEADFRAEIFMNMNTPEDYLALQRLFPASGSMGLSGQRRLPPPLVSRTHEAAR